MDSAICSTNFAAYGVSGFKYGEMIVEAILTSNGGNGVDINDIAEYIKERYEVQEKFRKHLRDKLKKLVAGNKLYKVGNRYRFLDGAATTEATNPTQTLNPEDSAKLHNLPSTSEVSEDTLEELREKLKKLVCVCGNKLVRVENYCKFLDGAGTTEATNPTQILNTEDSTEQQGLPSTSIVPEDMLKKFVDDLARTVAWAEYLEELGKVLSVVADKFDRLSEVNHMNLLLAQEFYKQCKEGKPIPLVMFEEGVFEDWFVEIDGV